MLTVVVVRMLTLFPARFGIMALYPNQPLLFPARFGIRPCFPNWQRQERATCRAASLCHRGSERHRRPPPALPAHVCSLLRHPLAGGGMSPHPATSALLGSVSGQKKRFFVPNATELQYLDKISRYVSQGNPSRF